MKTTGNCTKLFAIFVVVAALALLSVAPVFAAPQASITLTNCNSELCNANSTEWSLDKTPASQPLTGDNTITWTVSATRGATSDNFITVNGVMTVTNIGSAPATIGNIVVNLQKPRTGPNTGACKNIPWVSAAADIATASSGDAATSANIVAAGSQENVTCNASQGPPNYTVSGAQGTFTETAGSGTLEFTDAYSNTVWSITPEQTLPVGGSVTLRYTATFDNTVLGLAAGSQVRAEAIVTFGNAGARGGSGATAANIDIDGSGGAFDPDEANVRSVPCRVTKSIPTLIAGNDTVTLSDLSDDVTVTGTAVQVGNFSSFGSVNISTTSSDPVSIAEVCTAPGSATITNTAHLDGASSSVIVQGPQIGTDPNTGSPIYRTFEFFCVTGVALDASANASVTCEAALPLAPEFADGDYCTHTVQQWPISTRTCTGTSHDRTCTTVWSLMDFDSTKYTNAFPSGLRIGYVGGSTFDALWNASPAGYANLSQAINGATGAAASLTADLTDATSMAGGSFTGEVAALALNVGFSGSATSSGTPASFPAGLGALKYTNSGQPLDGKTIAQILAAADEVAGQHRVPADYGFDSGTAGYTAFELVLQKINDAFSKASTGADTNTCKVKQFAQDHLLK